MLIIIALGIEIIQKNLTALPHGKMNVSVGLYPTIKLLMLDGGF